MYESLNNVNSTSNMLFVSCLNWGSSRSFGAALYDVCPAAPSAKNNGTLQSYTAMNGGPGYSQFLTFNQTFGYDNVNRLTSANDSGHWSRNFGYDPYGNMWVPSGGEYGRDPGG
ncbi:MAG TPA: hypothetical protein VFR08_06735, partial [Candidatus Angelobacter sp.]|nr:hypothetical protein [Candidatus Angelobacter sp.]